MKVAALLSGGVDSSVALRLLKENGHDITAFYLKVWLEDELSFTDECPWEEDISFVRKVCKKESIPFEIIPLQREYREKILRPALEEVRIGRTPNPDILCNYKIKFGAFYNEIDKSFQKVASGHYARKIESNGRFLLMTAADPIKDQTYFLAHLNQKQLERALFPLGSFKKKEVRKMAADFNLPNKNRKDSQGLCFLGKINHHDFIEHHLGQKRGDFIESETGNKVGEHNGYWFFTTGQRKGLRLAGGPWYVVNKNVSENIVYISKNYFSESKSRNSFSVINLHWIGGEIPKKNHLKVKIRHGELTYNCTIENKPDGSMQVSIDRRDQGIAPGQFSVFYDDDVCLGCGMII